MPQKVIKQSCEPEQQKVRMALVVPVTGTNISKHHHGKDCNTNNHNSGNDGVHTKTAEQQH